MSLVDKAGIIVIRIGAGVLASGLQVHVASGELGAPVPEEFLQVCDRVFERRRSSSSVEGGRLFFGTPLGSVSG